MDTLEPRQPSARGEREHECEDDDGREEDHGRGAAHARTQGRPCPAD
jgi:hypothetical protein